MLKEAFPIGKPDFPKRKTKDVAMFFVSKWRLAYTEIFARKIREKVEKSSFIQKLDMGFHHLQLYLWEWRLFDNYIYFFFLLTNTFYLFRCIGPFLFLCDIGIGVWISPWCHFGDMSILFSGFESPLEATFSAWFLTSGLSGAHNLTTSRLKRKDSCLHLGQTLFVKRNIVRQLCLLFFHLWADTFCLFRCIESFPYCSISESGCLSFYLLSFLWYLDSVCQLLGSYGGHVLVVDPVKWAIWRPNLKASSLRHKDSCIHQMQALFLEGSIVRQLYSLFCSFD